MIKRNMLHLQFNSCLSNYSEITLLSAGITEAFPSPDPFLTI